MVESHRSEQHRLGMVEPGSPEPNTITNDSEPTEPDRSPARQSIWMMVLTEYLNSSPSDMPSPWPEAEDESSIFSGTVTLDPSRVIWAWDRLAQDTWVLEFGAMPHIMHHAVISTLKERGWGD